MFKQEARMEALGLRDALQGVDVPNAESASAEAAARQPSPGVIVHQLKFGGSCWPAEPKPALQGEGWWAWATRWKLRRAVKILNLILGERGLEKHPNKTFIARITKGFDYQGYHFSLRVCRSRDRL